MRISQLTENKVLYHGDNFGTTKLDPKWMMHDESNNQEGIGIYFSPDINVAKSYGNKISKISADNLRIVNSRMPVKNAIKTKDAVNLLKYIFDNDEDFWYKISDYIEVTGPEDVDDYHFQTLYKMMKDQEIRNWQSEIAMATDITVFVTGWNKYIPIDGLYEEQTKHHSIINTNIKAYPVNF